MRQRYLDSETIGLVGIPVLLQHAIDDGPVNLHYVFDTPVTDTLTLIEELCNDAIIGFNLTFDWFHLTKLYNLLRCVETKTRPPIPEEIYSIEHKASSDIRRWCLKPAGAMDLYLHALKGPYQCVMDRKPLNIRKVPRILAESLLEHLNKKITFKKIFFANRKDQDTPGGFDIQELDPIDPDFVNLTLKFKPSAGLKILCADAFNKDYSLLKEINNLTYPDEVEWCPYHLNNSDSWLTHFKEHNDYWHNNKQAIKYATDDIILTRDLDKYFGTPSRSDDDSMLALIVAVTRWHGFKIDPNVANKQLEQLKVQSLLAPKSPREAKEYIRQFMSPTEQLALTGTSKVVLESIEDWAEISDEEEKRFDELRSEADISAFINWRTDDHKPHPASIAALKVAQSRRADKRIDIIDKLLTINRFHPSFRIIGAKSGRMSGTGGLNPQGIPKGIFKEIFTLADEDFQLDGGDFSGFEITIMDAVYNDPVMREELLSGKKFHALFGAELYGVTYEQVMANKAEYYDPAKNGVFALAYGAQEQRLADTCHVDLETAREGYQRFSRKYVKVAAKRAEIINKFCSMTQPAGIGTKVIWKEPHDYIETIFGFRRYFTLENNVCRTLFELANNIPDDIKRVNCKVKRRDRFQTGAGAICSALYAAAFNIQSSNMRAAANHVIQGSGSEITKKTQRNSWDLQPVGVHEYKILSMNIHDELLNPNKCSEALKDNIKATVTSFKKTVPLIKIDWIQGMKSWASKG